MTTPVDTAQVDEIIGKILGGMTVEAGKRCWGGKVEGGSADPVEGGKKRKHGSKHRSRRRHMRGGSAGSVAADATVAATADAIQAGRRHRHSHRRRMGGEVEGGSVENSVAPADIEAGRRRRRHSRMGGEVEGGSAFAPAAENIEAGRRHRRHRMGGSVENSVAANVADAVAMGGRKHRHHRSRMYGGEAAGEANAVAIEAGRKHRRSHHRHHSKPHSVAGSLKRKMSGGEVAPDLDAGRRSGRKVYTAANGAKYVKNSRGQVRFIHGASPSYMRKIRRSR